MTNQSRLSTNRSKPHLRADEALLVRSTPRRSVLAGLVKSPNRWRWLAHGLLARNQGQTSRGETWSLTRSRGHSPLTKAIDDMVDCHALSVFHTVDLLPSFHSRPNAFVLTCPAVPANSSGAYEKTGCGNNQWGV